MIKPSMEGVVVTDHCLVRYLQRAMGLDVEMVRAHIMAICGGAAAFGATAVRAEGLKFEIVRGRVVTVVPDQQGPSKTTRERNRLLVQGRAE